MLGSWLGSWAWLWCVAATAAAATIMRCRQPLMAHRLIGRSHRRRLSVRGDGALRVGRWRLRLYGVAPLDGVLVAVFLRQAIAGRPVHLRVLRIERGVLVVVLRCDGVDLAASLLRQGLAMTRGSGARCYRQLQCVAQAERRGAWRLFDAPPPCDLQANGVPLALVFPWWQA